MQVYRQRIEIRKQNWERDEKGTRTRADRETSVREWGETAWERNRAKGKGDSK